MQRMLAVVKHAVDANSVYQQYSASAHGAHNTAQLLQCKTLMHELWSQQPKDELP